MSHAEGEVVADRRTYVGLARAMLATLPGLALCLIVMAASFVLQMIEERVIGQPYFEALVLAILVGVAYAPLGRRRPRSVQVSTCRPSCCWRSR